MVRQVKALRQKTGELQKFEALIAKYGGYVHAIISRVVGGRASSEDIEECTADALAALWNARGRIIPDGEKQYVAAVARNKGIDLMKKLSRTGEFLPLDEDILQIDAGDPVTELERKRVDTLLNEAVMALDPPDPEIFVRRYYWGESLHDIASALGLTERAVEGRLYRGRLQLKAYLEERL